MGILSSSSMLLLLPVSAAIAAGFVGGIPALVGHYLWAGIFKAVPISAANDMATMLLVFPAPGLFFFHTFMGILFLFPFQECVPRLLKPAIVGTLAFILEAFLYVLSSAELSLHVWYLLIPALWITKVVFWAYPGYYWYYMTGVENISALTKGVEMMEKYSGKFDDLEEGYDQVEDAVRDAVPDNIENAASSAARGLGKKLLG